MRTILLCLLFLTTIPSQVQAQLKRDDRSVFDKALLQNQWLWFHMTGGAVYAKIGQGLKMKKTTTIVSLLAICLAWEAFEYATDDVSKTYGSKTNFAYDSLGDILGAMVMAGVVIL